MDQRNKVLFVVQGLTCIALGIAYIMMPSNEEKLKRMQKYSRFGDTSARSFRPEVAQQAKEDEERNRHLRDAIKRAQTSKSLPLGRKSDSD